MNTRAAKPFERSDPEVRAVVVGILATLLLHLLLLWVAPLLIELRLVPVAPAGTPAERNPEFTIDLPPEEVRPPVPFRFVETNPDAPENIPDKSTNYGAQNQQLAQETPSPDTTGDRPAIEGQTEIKSTQIVTGDRAEPQVPVVVVSPAVAEQLEQQAAARTAANPLGGFEKDEGKVEDSFGSNLAPILPNSRAVPERIEGVAEAAEGDSPTLVFRVDPSRPMPRQAISQNNVRTAVFEENRAGTRNIGVIAHNALKNDFGQYLQKLIDAIDARWKDQIRNSRYYPAPGTVIGVTFVLNSAGEVSEIKRVDPATDEQASGWCVSAISPGVGFTYGEWTPQMIGLLGQSQELTFHFIFR
jgi:hypothetical protein